MKESEVKDISAEEISELQKQDERLKRQWNTKDIKRAGGSKSWSWVGNEILRSSYTNPKVNCSNPVQQVVVPKELRGKAMALVHDSNLVCHLGRRRTVDRVLSNFFWPGVGDDMIQ